MNTITHPLTNKNKIIITLGDPAGIGMEVTLKALNAPTLPKGMNPLIIGCKQNLNIVYQQLKASGITKIVNPADLDIQNLPCQEKIIPGKPNRQTGEASYQWLTFGTKYVLRNKARALVTAPIAKQFWHEAGHKYAGQTERLAEIAGVNDASMLFTATSPKTGWRLNTLLATTHIPLTTVSQKLTPKLVTSKLNILVEFCQRFKRHPRISIAGLNPHSGENGHIGKEEVEWLIPTLQSWHANNPAIQLNGPIPPDTCWIQAAKAWEGKKTINCPDGILALYHDQGLIPVKLIAFEEAVNTTLGLPFLRTSPDHGTGFDIAGLGCAKADSMLAAIKTAWDLTKNE